MAAKKRVAPCKVWDAFLRIPEPNTTDEAPIADDKWFEAKGVYTSAPAVLRLLRREVLPVVQRLRGAIGGDDQIHAYYFLVHDRESGVPTTKGDTSGYIHMRFYFCREKRLRDLERLLGDKWSMARPIPDEGEKIAGIDDKLTRARAIREILKKQSELALEIVDAYAAETDPMVMIQQVRQNLHYIANMFQMKVVG